MKVLRISPEVLRNHVHQALMNEFGDNTYVCCYNSDNLSYITTRISYIEERIISSLIRPYWYAFPTTTDEDIMVKFDGCFLSETDLRKKIHHSLQNTIDRIASEESGSEELCSKDDSETKEE